MVTSCRVIITHCHLICPCLYNKVSPHILQSKTFPISPTYQVFVDIYWLLKDCPYNCFTTIGCGQRAHIPVELCQVYTSDQVINRKGLADIDFVVCVREYRM